MYCGDTTVCLQDFFCPSSNGWPPFMRINPLLNWAYEDVWAYLRAIGAKHCKLYDQGYTSLGSIGNTAPNSALRRTDGTYAPAYKLAGTPLSSPRCIVG
jgi:FAD synthetase